MDDDIFNIDDDVDNINNNVNLYNDYYNINMNEPLYEDRFMGHVQLPAVELPQQIIADGGNNLPDDINDDVYDAYDIDRHRLVSFEALMSFIERSIYLQ